MIVCVATTSDDVAKVALPLDRLAVPSVTDPSRNVTVPVAVPLNCGVTVAVNVTAWPKRDGFTDDVTVVELEAFLTVCVIAADVLLAKLALPE